MIEISKTCLGLVIANRYVAHSLQGALPASRVRKGECSKTICRVPQACRFGQIQSPLKYHRLLLLIRICTIPNIIRLRRTTLPDPCLRDCVSASSLQVASRLASLRKILPVNCQLTELRELHTSHSSSTKMDALRITGTKDTRYQHLIG